MEDLIPFLIVITISIIGSAMRKKQKPQVPGAYVEEEPLHEVPQSDLLGWMERMLDDQKLPYTEKQVPETPYDSMETTLASHEPVVAQTPVKNLYQEYSGFISPEEKDEMMKKEAPRVFEKKMESKANSAKILQTDFADDLTKQSIKDGEIGRAQAKIVFNLRQAVVFSSILERKYI